jgi:hypothetical protein
MADQGGGRVMPPAAPQASQTPGYQSSHNRIVFETFEGIDTKSPRPAVQEKMMAWCSGFMPTGPSQLAILPDIGASIFNSGDDDIIWFQYGNIADVYYGFVLLSDGAIWAVNTTTNAAQEIMGPGTIQVPRTQMGFSQWGSQYILFAKDQTNGYWIWDGTLLYAAGGFGPIVTLDNAGTNYTSPPTVTVQTTGSGGGAQFEAQLEPGSGAIAQVTLTNPGSGFNYNDFAILSFSGGGSDDTATANATINSGGGITEIIMTASGGSYTYATTATAVRQAGDTGVDAVLAPNIQGGVIIGITVISPGFDYQVAPTIEISDPGYGSGAAHVDGGSGAEAYATVGLNGIGNITMTNEGTNYTSVPTVTIIGDGDGATANATLGPGGVVAGITTQTTGSGYTKALVQISGGNNAAAATPILMPFGWSGTAVEVYQDRVWISNGGAQADWPPKSRLIYSAPQNPCDPGDGGGALLGTDSFLRVGWQALKQTNGFLYLIGDSSVNNVAAVNTSVVGATQPSGNSPGTPGVLTTTFQNQNNDPQIGSAWPSSVQLFNRNILFANTQGIHASYGGAVQKVSAPLDGVYFAGPIYGVGEDFPAAVAQIFGIQVYMLLLPILDPTTNAITTELIMFDFKKFWTSTQGVTLTYIASQEINSTMTAWGTDGKNLFPLFQNPSTNFTKTVQSRLYSSPGYDFSKTAVRLYGICQALSFDDDLEVAIDNETDANSVVQTVGPGVSPTDVFGPYPVGQTGKLVGFTASTNCSSGNLLSLMLREQDFMLNN